MHKLRLIFSKRFFFILYKKIQLRHMYNKYVEHNRLIHEDIETSFLKRGCTAKDTSIKTKFNHLMLYYPEFAVIFFWRIGVSKTKWLKMFSKDYNFKIFKSTNIKGGLFCFHPYASVINAKSIGRNFEFRNGLTIGNKSNDNSYLPVIGNNVTVGAQVVIIGDIEIGDNVVIGAGSVVVKSFPSNCVIAGNPAKIIKTL
ncbi:serine O-acetyltransferase [Winogradskyella sediminis]|nr:serine O-acetyltransferase [Winogradskyella sediminis]